ncbi:adenylate/guanylate cyclase domain-containing protein [Zavarzinia sp. CC-PAN008]|uniref:adenylate/guanylate cyclase domain-containing protein n=1 Tax=Zavarzinia sp. CC-PAN008 TaxID=3243332 RepID=UPI003F74369C
MAETAEEAGGLAQFEQRVSALLDGGETFLAQDVAAQGLQRFPNSDRLRVLSALALMRTGAATDALRTLDPVLKDLILDEAPFRRALSALRKALHNVDLKGVPTRQALVAIGELADALDGVKGKTVLTSAGDPALLDLLGELYGEAWRHTGDNRSLGLSRQLYAAAFEAGRGRRAGANAAAAAWVEGDMRQAVRIARKVLETPAGGLDDAFWLRASTAIAHLILGDADAAEHDLVAARDVAGQLERVVPALRQVRLLKSRGVEVPQAVLTALAPPQVVVFTGHMLDRAGQDGVRFPAGLEEALRKAIDERLDAMNVQIGYSSAACGSDLLFIEAMLERGGEVNIILPCATEDFVRANVAHGGARWEMRFRNALRLAHSVNYATTEPSLGHESLYRFTNQMLHGLATLRAQFLETRPYLLAVWDMSEGSLVGGAADFIDQWADIAKLSIIDLDTLLEEHPEALEGPAPVETHAIARAEPERVIRAMLFADLVNYSKLREESMPAYLRFLDRLQAFLAEGGLKPEAINTWGDAIFAVMATARDLVQFSLRLKQGVIELGNREEGFEVPLNVRISLHAGPVFPGLDAFRGTPNFYGAHINRAARLEPVTVPGHIYATQSFVALLTAEESAVRNAAEAEGRDWSSGVVCEYVGVLTLAKNFGREPAYHIREATKAPPAGNGVRLTRSKRKKTSD